MRQETPETSCPACYGTGTRVGVHRSRSELESVLSKYGAEEVLFVQADANAAVQFAMHGRSVQLALPLPDPEDARFTRTPSGRLRSATARERAYDQALREHWRLLIVAVRGKLQSVESGISTFEQEFGRFLVPQLSVEKKRRDRRAPKAVTWLLGGSHSIAIALVAAFLVPASAVSAFALPTNVVGQLAAPFRSAVVDESSAGGSASGVALAAGGWSPSAGDGRVASPDGGRLVVLRSKLLSRGETRLWQGTAASPPPSGPADAPPAGGLPPEVSTDGPSNSEPPAPTSAPADPGTPPAPDGGWSLTSPPVDPPAAQPVGGEDSQPPTDSGSSLDSTVPSDPPADDSSVETPPPPGDSSSGPPAGTGDPPSDGGSTPPGNGNGNGNGAGAGQGNGPGNDQGNGQGQGLGQGRGLGNGKGKGGK